jgi:hypothetical protein
MNEPTSSRGKSVLKWALTIGIIIVLNLFFAVAIDTLMPQPKYETFCPQQQVQPSYSDQTSCVAAGGQWNPATPALQDIKVAPTKPVSPQGYCNPDYICGQKYSDAQNGYARNIFIILIVLGALSLLVGVFLVRISPAVSAGLSYGGVLSFIIASARYWSAAGDFIRLGIVAVALVALVGIGINKFKE